MRPGVQRLEYRGTITHLEIPPTEKPASKAYGTHLLILRHTFTPPNNTRMGHLCGPMDSHIRTIEAALQVTIAHRFEQFKFDGPMV